MAPIILIININLNELFLVSIIIIRLLTRTIRGFNQISLRKILAFSSINHIA
ncbi:hypothetical protein DD592_25915 [Enterobacter cloacae complex sp. 2DZ2F20B]|nr:hypothetical protein DD592_25915 [Enterobacter cloacae complex sp. 2DZ2F20B]